MSNYQPTTPPNKTMIALIVIVMLAGLGAGTYYVSANQSSDEGIQMMQQRSMNGKQNKAMSMKNNAQSYKDGTYVTEGDYLAPSGQESITVTMRLQGNAVVDASIKPHATDSTAAEYQQEFSNAIKTEVVGKSLNDIQLDIVAGASLTTIGFNNALAQIKNDAAS